LALIYLNSLSDKVTAKDVRCALQGFQKQKTGSSEQKKREVLTLAYKGAMNRINGQPDGLRNLAIKVLSWITCAKRQMTKTELQEALAVEVGDTKLDENNFPQVQDMVTVCAGLVTVDEKSSIIRLVHYTTQEYFEQTWISWFPDAQKNITNICLTYLSFDVFEAGLCQSNENFSTRLHKNVLYSYAAQYWGHHATTGPIEKDLVLELLENRAKASAASQAMLASGSYMQYIISRPNNMTGAHVAAYFGLEMAIIYLMSSGSDSDKVEVNSKDCCGWTPLSWAANRGHEAVVKLLLETGKVDVDSKDDSGKTALWQAVQGRHDTVVKLLLETGKVDVDLRDNLGRTSLSWTAERGNEAVVKLLLETGKVDVDSKDDSGKTALWRAVQGRHETVVKLLLETGKVDVDLRDDLGRTPLSWTAERGNEAVVKLLLETGKVDVDSKDDSGKTALWQAVQGRHETVVKLLLETGKVDVDLRDDLGRTPLSWAANRGHEAIVKLLVETGKTDVNLKDSYGKTPLQAATEGGYKVVVMLLQSYCKTS
jgi:ankyrin repeat protein